MAKEKPVDHGLLSGTATVGWESAKGAAKGLAVLPLAGAAIAGAVVFTIAAVMSGGATVPLTAALGAALPWGLGAAAVGGALGLVGDGFAAPIIAGVGALLGLARGGDRINGEKAAYKEMAGHKAEKREQQKAAELENASNAGVQQGYGQGFKEGQMAVVNRLRELQYNMIQQQMSEAANANPALAAANQNHEQQVSASAPSQDNAPASAPTLTNIVNVGHAAGAAKA